MRAVLCGYYGMGNGGDEALLASLLQMLPAQVTPIVLSGNPVETAQRYGVEAVPRKSLQAVWRAMRRSQLFIWGGGSLMQDASSALNPLYYGGLMKLAQWQGLKTVAWAQGIGPLNRATSRWLTRWVLRHCDAVSVRDAGSAKLLAEWNIDCWLAPDPVWALEAAAVPGLWDLPAPRVAVALRPARDLTPERLEILTQALASFQKATQTCILLVPFQPVKDHAIAAQIAARLPGPHRIFQLEQPAQLKGLFRGVEMTIGMRFHALIMSAAEGCRCFAISYDPKVSQLMQALALPGWHLSPTEAEENPMPQAAHQLTRQWLEAFANDQPLLSEQIQSLTDRAFMHQVLLNQTAERFSP
ncbi:MAG: polysaccharide pyruvyl transferase CsaB [Leptolyngbya sp. SIO4C1]|nr:polysaccharide pyruvyl transferase CsaB [Leptolyngbya sp. SIO4C1]